MSGQGTSRKYRQWEWDNNHIYSGNTIYIFATNKAFRINPIASWYWQLRFRELWFFQDLNPPACRAQVVIGALAHFYEFIAGIAIAAILGAIKRITDLVNLVITSPANFFMRVWNYKEYTPLLAVLSVLTGVMIQLGGEALLTAFELEGLMGPENALTTDQILSTKDDIIHINWAYGLLGVSEAGLGAAALIYTDDAGISAWIAVLIGGITTLGSVLEGIQINAQMNYAAALCQCPRGEK